jgi:hypothetical protein
LRQPHIEGHTRLLYLLLSSTNGGTQALFFFVIQVTHGCIVMTPLFNLRHGVTIKNALLDLVVHTGEDARRGAIRYFG